MEVNLEELLNLAGADLRYNGESQEYIKSMRLIPDFDYSRFYSSYPGYENIITQGDALRELPFVNLPDTVVNSGIGFILSNTCDAELGNDRKYPAKLLYAPILSMAGFVMMLEKQVNASGERKYSDEQISAYLSDIRKQKVSQIFYLPNRYDGDEGIVFFDSICSIDNKSISRDNLDTRRIFSLSMYGWHILLIRIAHFFTKLSQDTVELRLKV